MDQPGRDRGAGRGAPAGLARGGDRAARPQMGRAADPARRNPWRRGQRRRPACAARRADRLVVDARRGGTRRCDAARGDRQDRQNAIAGRIWTRSEEHTSELQSLMRISYAVFCLKKKKKQNTKTETLNTTKSIPN